MVDARAPTSHMVTTIIFLDPNPATAIWAFLGVLFQPLESLFELGVTSACLLPRERFTSEASMPSLPMAETHIKRALGAMNPLTVGKVKFAVLATRPKTPHKVPLRAELLKKRVSIVSTRSSIYHYA